MKLINCPLNGPRNAQEFVFGGEVRDEPDARAPTREWAEHIFYDDNNSGIVDEWWCHTASAYWFVIRRDRTTDEILATFAPAAYLSDRNGHR